jgi:type I restriction enzyme S subunit
LIHATPRIRELGSGTTFPELSKTAAKGIEVPVAPLDEQRRIVAAIEEQLSRLDAVEATIEGLVGRFDRGQGRISVLRRAILRSAFTGGLIAQDPADEPASVLLERVRADSETRGKPARRKRTLRT